jgi:hypothetical protein
LTFQMLLLKFQRSSAIFFVHQIAYVLFCFLILFKVKWLEKKNYVRKNTVAIHSNLRGKLQCFPHIL